jgi:hypothetical protein
VLAALEVLVPEAAAVRQALFQSPQPSIEALLKTLINTLSNLSAAAATG